MKKIQLLLCAVIMAGLSAAAFCAEKKVPDLEVPWLSTYYIQPQATVEDEVKIGFYVTDWHQSEYRFGDNSRRFHASLKIRKKNTADAGMKKWSMKHIKAGDHEFNAGKFPAGEYIAELSAIDMHGRKSPVLFHEFRILENLAVPAEETYTMTESDLAKYKISSKGDLGIFRFLDAKGKNEKDTAAMVAEEAAKVKVPSGKYMVIAGAEKYNPEENRNHRGVRNAPLPEWLPNPQSWKTCKVLYADDYDKAKVEADAAATGNGLNQFLKDVREKGFRKVIMLPGTYRISNTTPVEVPSGLTWDLNGCTIKMNQFAGHQGRIIRIRDGVDTHLVNGIVEGDYFEHDYKNSKHMSEWVLGIDMDGESKYCSVERILLRYITGYGTTNGFHGNRGKYIPARNFTPGTIDEKTGKELPDAKGLLISEPADITSFVTDGGYLACSRWLGYQGMSGNDWSLRFHFYGRDGKYLETIRTRQYRIVRIPAGAEKVRVTAYATDPKTVNDLIFNYFRKPWNSWFQDVFVLSARCVGMAPSAMYNFRFENCSFARDGEFLAKCAFDAEDGWDMMQDVWIVRNKFFKNIQNDLLTCAGHNFIIEDNEARLHLWSRTNSYVVRNNAFESAYYGAAGRARSGCVRISGNTYTTIVQLGDRGGTVDPALAAVDPSQWETKENKPAEQPWFITMKDFENVKSITVGSSAMIAGATLKNKSLGTVALAYSTLENCKFGPWLTATKFFRSKLKNITGAISWDKTLTVTECELEDGEIQIQHANWEKGGVAVKDSKLKNTLFSMGWWEAPRRLIFENCTFNYTTRPVVRTPVYSIGEIIFINCKFDTGNAPVIEINDMRKNGSFGREKFEEQAGKIIFRNCTIANQKGCIVNVVSNISNGSKKKIILTAENCRYDIAPVTPEVSWWDVPLKEEKTPGTENK